MKEFFAAGSPFLGHPLLTEERTRQEIDFLFDRLALEDGSRVLDIGCGFGRHSIELARRGCQVVGIDPSPAMVAAAQEKAAEAGVSVTFQQSSGEGFTSAQPFDAALCLFTTLGQIDPITHTDNRGLLPAVAKNLRSGGRLALELPQRGPALAALKPADRFGGGDRYTAVERSFDAQADVVTERFHLVSPGQAQTYRLRYRLFAASDVAAMLASAGLQTISSHAGYSDDDLTDGSPVMLFICQAGEC